MKIIRFLAYKLSIVFIPVLLAFGVYLFVQLAIFTPDDSDFYIHFDPSEVWSSDNRYVAVHINSSKKFYLYIVDVETFESQKLYEKLGPLDYNRWVWSPNGHRIAIVEPDSISIFDPDTGKQQIFNNNHCIVFCDLPTWDVDNRLDLLTTPNRTLEFENSSLIFLSLDLATGEFSRVAQDAGPLPDWYTPPQLSIPKDHTLINEYSNQFKDVLNVFESSNGRLAIIQSRHYFHVVDIDSKNILYTGDKWQFPDLPFGLTVGQAIFVLLANIMFIIGFIWHHARIRRVFA